MTDITELAQRTDLLMDNALETAKQLRELSVSEVAENIFESIVENENGKEIQFERPISDLAFAAFLQLERLVDALEKAQTISAAAEKLVRCKCRYHSEQNYRALAALFGVTAPDLPPLNSESRTVKLVDCDFGAVQHMSGGSTEYCHGFVDGTQNAIRAITAAGIKWEAE